MDMDCLLENDILVNWLLQYGGLALFFLLAIGIVALPVPEETLMVLTGLAMHSGKLPITSTIIAAYGGSICGITMSYWLGRTAGVYFFHKYGKWLGIREKQLQKVHIWFEHWGKWTLLFGYFIPGVRHFTGFTAGTTDLEYKHFALFAYTGAIFWVSTFLSIGYFFGNYCFAVLKGLELSGEEIVIGSIVLACGGYIAYRYIKRKRHHHN